MTDLVPVTGAFGVEGLEDFDESDMIMPTLRLGANQNAGYIIDGLSGQRYPGDPGIEVIVLGIVKQRILWPPEIGEAKEDPMCKSYEFAHGFPDPDQPARFPWAASGFIAPQMGAPAPVLTCEDCKLKEWGSHPKTDTAWCTEQHTYVILQQVNEILAPAILTLQRTGIKPSKAYMSSFARTQTPMFVTTTRITLSVQRRGSVDYSVPILTRGNPTSPEMFPDFAAQYRRIRSVLHTPRSGNPDEVPVAAPVNTNTYTSQPAPAPQPAAQAPAVPPTVQPPVDVAPPAQPAPAPVAQPITQPADVAPPAQPIPVAQPVAQPVAPMQVAQPAGDVAPPMQVAQPVQPIAQPVPVVATVPDDDLPF